MYSLVSEALNILKQEGVDSSRFEIHLLLAHILGVEPSDIHTYSGTLTAEQRKLFNQMLEKRANHWPIDKIIGHKGFYKYEFSVNTDVLSPRADTEILVEKALEKLKTLVSPKILEFGVGSGCILLSLLAERQDAFGFGIDVSEKALQVALYNAEALGVTPRCRLFRGSWFDECLLEETYFQELDMIVSNPPYIPTQEIETLEVEVKNFDPLIALDGGADGIRDYHQIFKLASQMLRKEGFILVEIGEKQTEHVIKAAEKYHLKELEIATDLTQTDRCIIFKK